MTPRWRIGVACAVAVVLVGAAVFAARGDAGDELGYRLASDNIAAPEITSTLAPSAPSEPNTEAAPEPPTTEAAAAAAGDPVRLAVAGDVGTGEDAEYRTAEAMDARETENDYAALLLLGDNVYPDGDPDELQRAVFDPLADVLDNGTALLAVLGNHDVRDGNGDAHAAAIGMPGRWYATRIGDVLIVSLDSTLPDDDDQLAWLSSTLASNDAVWTIATLHHPPYSGGYHGSSIDVRDAFTPLFEQYGVQLVLAGHDHDYQRSEVIDGVTYVVSGGAAKLRPADRADFTEVARSTYHFVELVVWPDRMEVSAIDQSGEIFDAATLLR